MFKKFFVVFLVFLVFASFGLGSCLTVVSDGFENGLGEWDDTAGWVSTQSNVVKSGSYALNISHTMLGYVTVNVADIDRFYCSFWYRTDADALAPVGSFDIVDVWDDVYMTMVHIYVYVASNSTSYMGVTTQDDYVNDLYGDFEWTLVPDTWYYIEFEFVAGDSLKVWVDGVLGCSLTGVYYQTVDRFSLYYPDYTGGAYYDDFFVDDLISLDSDEGFVAVPPVFMLLIILFALVAVLASLWFCFMGFENKGVAVLLVLVAVVVFVVFVFAFGIL